MQLCRRGVDELGWPETRRPARQGTEAAAVPHLDALRGKAQGSHSSVVAGCLQTLTTTVTVVTPVYALKHHDGRAGCI